jgi:hypothetical protein
MFFRRRKKSAQRTPVRRSRPSLEILEDRLAPAILTVTGWDDTIAVDNKVTFREALASANNNANVNTDVVAVGAYGNDTIKFNIPGWQPINLTDTLTITDPVTIDGFSQPGSINNSKPFGDPINAEMLIVLNNGAGVGDAIQIHTNDSTIKGLVIGGFGDDAIEIKGNNNKVQGNFLGTNVGGNVKAANNMGVFIDIGSTGNLIGGVNPGRPQSHLRKQLQRRPDLDRQ